MSTVFYYKFNRSVLLFPFFARFSFCSFICNPQPLSTCASTESIFLVAISKSGCRHDNFTRHSDSHFMPSSRYFVNSYLYFTFIFILTVLVLPFSTVADVFSPSITYFVTYILFLCSLAYCATPLTFRCNLLTQFIRVILVCTDSYIVFFTFLKLLDGVAGLALRNLNGFRRSKVLAGAVLNFIAADG